MRTSPSSETALVALICGYYSVHGKVFPVSLMVARLDSTFSTRCVPKKLHRKLLNLAPKGIRTRSHTLWYSLFSAMSSFTPIPDVYYRLQNVDYGTFLELRTLTSKGELVLRPQKDGMQQQVSAWRYVLTVAVSMLTSLQQWTFVETADKSQYKVQNALPGSKRFLLTTGDVKGSVSTSSAGSAKAWSLRLIKNFNNQFLSVLIYITFSARVSLGYTAS